MRLLRISIRLLPLKPMLIGEPLYSQDNCSFADVEKSISSEETSKRPDSMWKRMSWLLSLANGNTRRKALCKPLRSTVTSLGLFGMTEL
ncbi:Uncharacterised protein [Segatella copri]|nr:Uncharacterised protein [Segatella copri]